MSSSPTLSTLSSIVILSTLSSIVVLCIIKDDGVLIMKDDTGLLLVSFPFPSASSIFNLLDDVAIFGCTILIKFFKNNM